MDNFIVFPTGEKAREVKQKFSEIGGIGGIVGAIDYTHIRIQRPHGNQLFYINHKGYHSLNIQAVCYACKPYLLTPYDRARNRAGGRFNKRHTKQRVLIEQAYGCLKRRFHVHHGEIRLSNPAKVCAVVIACCVLHNMVTRRSLPDFFDVIDNSQLPEEVVQTEELRGGRSGPVLRDEIARMLMAV
uniref:DDE Tnp4 domain-containing protein n=1 Tax=Plectus sambesii TaxID=2011161 RepID=A0A914USR7_9BILA